MSDNLGFEGFTKIDTPKEQPNTEMSFEAEGFKSLSKIQPTEQDSLKSIIQMSLPGGDQEEIAATIGLVNKFSGIYGTDINDTLNSLDSMVADYFQQTIPRKDAFRAIQDEFKISRANNEIAFLTNRALNTNDEAERAKLFEQVKEVEKFMPSPDMVNRGLGTKFMKAAASLTGSSLDSLIVGGAVGAMAAPVLAAMGASSVMASLTPTMQKVTMMAANTLAQSGATFVTSTALERGAIAKDMLDNGIDIETVKKVSATYGMIAGAIETAGIEVMLSRFPGLKQLTQKAFMTTAIKERAKHGIAKGIMQIAKDNLIQIPMSIIAETSTETLQTLVEIKAVEVGQALDDEVSKWNRTRDRSDSNYISDEYREHVKQQLIDTAKQTAMGIAVMGGVGASANIAIDTRQNAQQTGKYSVQQKKVAEIKKGMAEKQTVTTEAIKAQESARAAFNENPTDANLSTLQKADEVVQNMNIKEMPEDDMLLLEAERQELLADTPSVENIARLNAIAESMEMMQRKEMPVSEEKQIWQMRASEYDASLETRTSGMAEGIQQTEANILTDRFRQRIKQYTPGKITDGQTDAILAVHSFMFNAANIAQGSKGNFETYLSTVFNPDIAAPIEQVLYGGQDSLDKFNLDESAVAQYRGSYEAELAKGKTVRGAMITDKEGKALYLLTKNSNFSTWIHEGGHTFRKLLPPAMLQKVEALYGVKNGIWTVPQEEAFTEDLTTYLMTGQAPTEQLRNVFQIIADALIAIYKSLANRGEISPEIKAVFDEMFQVESSILFQSDKNLVAVHNMNSDRFLDAVEIGGISMPSLAIINKNIPFDSFGDMTLIAPKEIVDPKTGRANVYNADVYSPRYPSMQMKVDRKAIVTIAEELAPAIEKIGKASKDEYYQKNYPSMYSLESNIISRLEDNGFRFFGDRWLNAYWKINVQGENIDVADVSMQWTDVDEAGFQAWAREKFSNAITGKQFFRGYTPSGKRRYADYTLDNIYKEMKKSAITGGENFFYGLPSIRAIVAKKYTSLAQIKKDEGKILSDSEFEMAKEETDRLFNDILDEADSAYTGNSSSSDNFASILVDGIKRGNIKKELAEYGYDLNEETLGKIRLLLNTIREMPTEYFEAKVKGKMYFSDFAGAVIPKKASDKVKQWFVENKIPFIEYEGKADARARALVDITNQIDNQNILFQSEKEQKEIDIIRSKYENTESWMKAPNGQATNLNERQWLQVRTDSFKKWFGDWEAKAALFDGEKLKNNRALSVLTQNEFSSLMHDFDDLVQIKDMNECKTYLEEASEAYQKLKKSGIEYIDAYHVTSQDANVFSEKIKGSESSYIGETSGERLREPSVYGFFDLDDIGKSANGIMGADNKKLRIIKIKVPIEDFYKIRWDGNFNLTYGAYTGVRIVGDVSADKITGIYNVLLTAQDQLIPENASKVVDENGEPLVVYHGGSKGFAEFDEAKSGGNFKDSGDKGFYFTNNSEMAYKYAQRAKEVGKEGGEQIYPVFLNLSNPYYIDSIDYDGGFNEMSTISFYEEIEGSARTYRIAKNEGNDGIMIINRDEKIEGGNTEQVYNIFSPEQIKSATANTGAFDSSNPNILFQSEITPEQQKAFDSAVEAHGLTDDIEEAGYILPDGRMLDFSGRFNATGYKKQGDRFIAEKDDYLKNNRSADHRDILYTDRADNGNEAMQNFISMGAIRIDADAGVIDMATMPTAQQYKVIQKVIENAGGATVEINYNGKSVNFDSEATPAKIIGQIKQFFKTGVINEKMLFQSENPAHRDAVERAVEAGLYVPDNVLQEYISEEWAQEETEARADYGKDALEYLDKPNGEEEYILFEITLSDKPRSYFKAIWDNIQPSKVITRDQSNKTFVEGLDKDTLTGYLKAYRYAERQVAFPDTFMQNSYYGLLKNRSDLTEGEYKQLMIKIKADPRVYREFFATVFEDDAALAQLQRERELFPDATALEKLRAENKRLRKENKDYGKSVEQLKQSASLFAGQRDYARTQGIYLNDALESAVNESEASEKILKKVLKDTIYSARKESALQVKAVKAELTDVIKDARADGKAQVKAVKADAKLQMKKERILNAAEKRKLKSDLLEGFKQYKENKKQIALMEKLIRQIMKKPAAMVERSYAERIEAIQAKYRAQRTSPQRMEFIDWAKNQMLTADDKTRVELQKEISKVSLKDLSIDELMKIADEIRELAQAGFTVRQNYLIDQKIMRGETADKIVQENKTDKTTGTFGTVGTGNEKKGNIYKNIAATWADMRRLTKILGKTSEEFLTDKVHEARNEEIRNQLRRKKAATEKMKELNITPSKLAEKVIFESDTRPVNRNSILGFYIAMQNDDTLAKIYYGNLKNNPMRDRFLEEVNENISAEEIAFANWMMDSLSGEDRDRFFDAVLEDTNTRPEAVARYFPAFVADSNTDTHELNKELAQEVLNRSPYGKAYPSKKNAISRLKNISPEHQSEMRVDALGVYFEIIDRSEHFIAFGKLIKDLQAIYNKKEVKEAIALKHGKQFNNTIQTYLNITANPAAYRNQIAQTKFFGSMVSNSIVAPLLFNIPSVLKNITGFFLYMRESSLTEMAAAQAEIAVNYNKVKSFVYENSPKVEDRAIDDYLQKLDYSLNNPEMGQRAVKEIQKIGLTPLTLMDSYTVIVGWYAVYKTEMKRSGDHEAAVKLADDVFLKTQPQSRPEDSPIVYQDKTLRPFLAFTRQTNQIFQMIAFDTPQHLREGKYRQFVFDVVAISMTAIIIGMITRRRPQDDEEELLKDLVAQFAVSLPLVGGTLSNMVQGSFYADRGFNLPIASTVAQAYRTAETVFDEYGTAEEAIDEGIRLATEAMKVYGLPSVLTQRAFKAWEEEDLRYVLMGGIPQE